MVLPSWKPKKAALPVFGEPHKGGLPPSLGLRCAKEGFRFFRPLSSG